MLRTSSISIDQNTCFGVIGYRIVQMAKSKVKVSMQLDKPRQTVEKTIADLRNWEKTVSTARLYKLEHQPSRPRRTVPFKRRNTVDGCKGFKPKRHASRRNNSPRNWQMGPVCQMLTLAGDGYIDIGNSITFSATNAFSVGGWFSPSQLNSTHRYLAHKDGQFSLGTSRTCYALLSPLPILECKLLILSWKSQSWRTPICDDNFRRPYC